MKRWRLFVLFLLFAWDHTAGRLFAAQLQKRSGTQPEAKDMRLVGYNRSAGALGVSAGY